MDCVSVSYSPRFFVYHLFSYLHSFISLYSFILTLAAKQLDRLCLSLTPSLD